MTTPSIDLLEHAQQHFEHQLGISLADLLAPIAADHPAGYCAKSGGVYQAIQHARRSDDPTLPQGPWQHDLKRADWVTVSRTALDTLMRSSKDLQLATWLLESQVHQFGFAGIAPPLVLIDGLIRRYGDALHPQEAGGGSTHRANVLRWINRKLLPVLKQVPITARGQDGDFGWADREAAWHREQHKTLPDSEPEGPALAEVTAAMGQTPAQDCQALQVHLCLAIEAAQRLTRTIDECFSGDKPSLAAFIGLLRQILAAVETELRRRGLVGVSEPAPVEIRDEAAAAPAAGNVAADRAHAYAMLEQAAYTLLHTDPHSPAPYLVQRAVQWGRLSTSELYKEVFIRMGGQLNIFELLGLETPQAQAE
jgi:type VI secretion system protein ImpA